MEHGADTPTTGEFIGQNRHTLAQASDSNSGIPAWRVRKVSRILLFSE
jgi:hypothetical protein